MRLFDTIIEDVSLEELTMEGRSMVSNIDSGYSLYVLLTDTNTYFSKVSKFFTEQPYNHVSLMFHDSFDEIYTYALINPENGLTGGFKMETAAKLRGSRYSLYIVSVSSEAWHNVKDKIKTLSDRRKETKYSFRSIINFILKRDVFENVDELRMICSEFVLFALSEAGVKLKKKSGHISPYDLVKNRALKHVRRGTIR